MDSSDVSPQYPSYRYEMNRFAASDIVNNRDLRDHRKIARNSAQRSPKASGFVME